MKGTQGKRGEIDKQAHKDFDYIRQKKLFKRITAAQKATGLNISKMESVAGISKRSGIERVAEGLAQQQDGGKIKSKSTPLKGARTGKAIGKKLRQANYIQKLNPIDLRNKRKNRFIARVKKAKSSGRPVMMIGRGGTIIISRVRTFKRTKTSARIKFLHLYRINAYGLVTLKKQRPFVVDSGKNVMKTMPQEFAKQAQRRIEKRMKR